MSQEEENTEIDGYQTQADLKKEAKAQEILKSIPDLEEDPMYIQGVDAVEDIPKGQESKYGILMEERAEESDKETTS